MSEPSSSDTPVAAVHEAEHGVVGRVVIVTGAGRGIGRGVAIHLAKHGASVVVAEHRKNRLDECVAELAALGAPHLGVECDVGVKTSIDAMVAATVAEFGRVDGIVNNAQSFVSAKPLEDVTENDMDLLYRTGPLGTLWAMQAVLPHMRSQGFGRIVNVASANGVRGAAGFGPYNASKEAIRALTRTAAREWGRHGIVVNCYAPAAAGHRNPPDAEDVRRDAWDAMYLHHPIGRDGDPEADIAPAVLFLLSDAARWVNGQTIMLDGGGFMVA
jgi:2-hydroxycyclohexanecarboxyl-CoA dehydrogenase